MLLHAPVAQMAISWRHIPIHIILDFETYSLPKTINSHKCDTIALLENEIEVTALWAAIYFRYDLHRFFCY